MPIDRRLTFDEALAAQKTASDAMDDSRRHTGDRAADPALVLAFHAAGLNVRRCIHRDHPDHYGNPDEHARPDEIAAADDLLNAH